MAFVHTLGLLLAYLLYFLTSPGMSFTLPSSTFTDPKHGPRQLSLHRRAYPPATSNDIGRRSVANSTENIETDPTGSGTGRTFRVFDTSLKVVLEARPNGLPIEWAFINSILFDTREEMQKFASVMVTPTKLFRADHEDVVLKIGRIPDLEDYPNLYCGDIAKLIVQLRQVVLELKMFSEFDVEIYCFNDVMVGVMQLSVDNKRYTVPSGANSTHWDDAGSSNAGLNITGPEPFDNSFDVPNSSMRIHILPFAGPVKLLKKYVVACFAAMQKEISLHAKEEIVTRLFVRSGNVQLTLTGMDYFSYNLSTGLDLLHKDAQKINRALYDYFVNFDDIYSTGYQVLRNPYFIARGQLTMVSTRDAIEDISVTPS